MSEATTPIPCVDEYDGDCALDFPNQCDNPVVHQVCKKTCGTCYGKFLSLDILKW